jgi:SNF2 family DNA or RNA helicase
VLTHVGNQRNRELSNFSYYDLVISTYHTVRQDSIQLSSFRFHYIICDESQMIKNPSSKLYNALVTLQSDHKVVLTGTPIENSLTDLWSQINFVNPGLLGTLSFFKRSFVQPIEKRGNEEREEKLRELISPFILRRTKDEVARELPPLYQQVLYVDMTDTQKRLYEEEKSQARNAILENFEEIGMEGSSLMVLQALTRLRQIANHPDLVEEYEGEDSGKFTEVYRNIESVVAEGHKLLLFSSFVKHLNLFKSRLEGDGIGFAYLTGSRNQRQREEAVKDFQTKSDCSIFLISLKAGGVGLNLTAADYVFILDPWWNPAAEMQALSRAHRIGQENRVFVYRFISNDTIEEKIQRLQERKRELAEAFVTVNNPMKSLSEKELLELFS